MIKVRVQGTPKDIKTFWGIIEKIKCMEIESKSDIYDNYGTNRFKRSYADIELKIG